MRMTIRVNRRPMRHARGVQAAILAVLLVGVGCDGSSIGDSRTSWDRVDLRGSKARAARFTGSELSVTGEVGEVDRKRMTFMVKVDGYDHAFAFDDRTEVVDRLGRIHSLAELRGAPVTVSYRGAYDYWYAVRIELV